MRTPRIDRAYQAAMLVKDSIAVSRHQRRSTPSEWPCARAIRASTTRPPPSVTARKVNGGKWATPIFITGQFTPHTSVSTHNRKASRRDSVGDIL